MLTDLINGLSDLLYSYILIILLLGTGIYFTFRTRFVQFRLFIESIRVVAQPGDDENGLSSFQALMVSTASRVGTGNIAGISTAICLGGPGAVFWMWLTAILGSASAFIESTLKQISKITEVLVPFMGIFYLAVALFVTVTHYTLIPKMFSDIFSNAFDIRAIFGGFAGSCVMNGIKRGLFSNEAGVGSAPNAAASAAVSHPVKQGLVQMLSVFIDTILICSATACLLLCSGVAPSEELKGMPWVQAAASESLGSFGTIFITVAL